MFSNRTLSVAVLAASLILCASALPASAGPASARKEIPITCTNPASGARWQIRIDYGRATVDANAAEISNSQISWHDPTNNSNYTLDRQSGELTAVAPSSTGGYFLHDRCKLD